MSSGFRLTLQHWITSSQKGSVDSHPYTLLQLKSDQTERLLNKPYVNKVFLTGQNSPLKYCQPLELLTQLGKDIDLSMLKIWNL